MIVALSLVLAWSGPPIESPAASAVEDPIEPAASERVTVVPVVPVDDHGAPEPEPAPSVTPAPDTPGRPSPPPLHVHWEVDLPILFAAGGLWLGTELSLARLVPAQPRWLAPAPVELRVREAAIWRSPATARLLSDVFAYGLVPGFGLALTLTDVGRSRQWRVLHEDLVVVLESVAVAAMLTQSLKLASARVRPYAYEAYLPSAGELGELDQRLVYEPDALMSFPSGHATFAFAFAASFATVATLRERPLAPYLWGLGVPMAGVVAYLRVAGHRHWVGDVLVGSTIGSLVGAGLPLLLHHPRFGLLARLSARKRRTQIAVMPSASGAVVTGRF